MTYHGVESGPLLWGLEVVFLHIEVGDDVVVNQGVFARAEVPRLCLGVVVALLEALELVVEVEDVVGLLVAEGAVAVLREGVGHRLLLGALHEGLSVLVVIDLRDGVVDHVVVLDELVGHLHVGVRLALEVALLLDVVRHVAAPVLVAVGKAGLLREFPDVCN